MTRRRASTTNAEQPEISPELVADAEEQIIEQSKRIEFYITEYSIELLASKMQNGDFEVPAYQREYTWESERKSRFIESVLMGLPIPFLFFWEHPQTGKLEIVDGSQRLRTVQEFILGEFALGELAELSLLSGFRFKDLPKSRQRKIMNRSIRGIVLNEHADEQSRFDLFERINTGSKQANTAEVRRGALGGPFMDLVISLTEEGTFTRIAPVTQKQRNERERDELITRFFAYSDGLENYDDKVARFIFNYTKHMNAQFLERPNDIEVYRARFLETMQFVYKTFPWGFRRSEKGTVTPRARFEAIAIGSYLALAQCPRLAQKDISVEAWLQGAEFKTVTGSDGANAISRLRDRIYFVRDQLLKDCDE